LYRKKKNKKKTATRSFTRDVLI